MATMDDVMKKLKVLEKKYDKMQVTLAELKNIIAEIKSMSMEARIG